MIRRSAIITLALVVVMTCGRWHCAKAHADLIECDYPGIGQQVQVDVLFVHATGFYCDFPVEINGAHRHCENGAGGVGGAVQANGIASTFAFGGSGWSCTWRCPDLSMAEAPNPPGAWNKHITPQPCHTVAPPHAPFGIAAPTPPLVGDDTNPTPPNPDSLRPTGG